MKRIAAIAVVAIAIANPAFAGGYGYRSWDEYEYGCNGPGSCRLPGPGAYGYYGVGDHGYVPRRPRKPPVPVEPFACHNPMFVPSAQRWVCPPVNVRPE